MEKLFFERTLPADADTLWSVLTEPAHLKEWYFDFSEQWGLETGHVFEWTAGPPDEEQWLHRGMIIEVLPGKKLTHTWEYPGYIGRAQLIWELIPLAENSTLLQLTFEFLIPFDESVEALRRANFAEGWDFIINQSLPGYLEKL